MVSVADLMLTITGKNLADRALREVGDGVETLGRRAEDAGERARKGLESGFRKGLDSVAEGGGEAERSLIGIADIAGFSAEQLGLNIGPTQELARGFGDLAGGLEGVLSGGPAFLGMLKGLPGGIVSATTATWGHVTALYAQATAFIVANAPILLIIGSLALLAAGVFLVIKYWDEIVEAVPFLGKALDVAKGVVTGATDAIVGAFTGVLDFVRNNWKTIAVLISGPFAPLVLLATDAFGVRSKLEGAFSGMVTFVKARIDDVVKFHTELPGRIVGALGDLASLLFDKGADLIRGLVNGMKSINIPNPLNMIPGSGMVGGVIGSIPGFAEGGIVPGPLGAPRLILAHGGEEVRTREQQQRSQGGVNVTINIAAWDARSVDDWLRMGGAARIVHAVTEQGGFR